jgi:Spy/CpxP family protein refolding chaperone
MAKLRKYGTTTRTERRREAEVRQESYNTLTPQQKLDKLPPTGSNKQRAKLEHLVKFGRKVNEAATPSKTKKMKDDKPSRKERWEEKQKNS